MVKINDESYFIAYGWMSEKLGLKGTELSTFAVIYGFVSSTGTGFSGSQGYIAKFIGTSRGAVVCAIKQLIKKGYIETGDSLFNNKKEYTVNEEILRTKAKPSCTKTEQMCSKSDSAEMQSCTKTEQMCSKSDSAEIQSCTKTEQAGSKNGRGCTKIEQPSCTIFVQGSTENVPNNTNNNIIINNIYDKKDKNIVYETDDVIDIQIPDGEFKSEMTEIIERWNSYSIYGLPKVTKFLPDTQRYINLACLIETYGAAEVLKAEEIVKKSDFLIGLKIDFDFFTDKWEFKNILEGGYDNTVKPPFYDDYD